jgi:hypothetical protein
VRILLVAHTPRVLTSYDDALARLSQAGHEVLVSCSRPDKDRAHLEALVSSAGLRLLDPPPRRADAYAQVARGLRATIDYARYFDPRYARAEFLRGRFREHAHALTPRVELLGRLPAWARRPQRLLAPLLAAERAIPSDPAVEGFLRAVAPDVVLVSPLVNVGSWLPDVVKAAAALGLTSAALIPSWDNLTNKGHLREIPDAVLVWNERQREEAVELHGVAPERVRVTGAQSFDRWFGRRPERSREAFCTAAGLPAERPFVLFVGSTSNINAPSWEDAFLRRWIAALRAAGGPGAGRGAPTTWPTSRARSCGRASVRCPGRRVRAATTSTPSTTPRRSSA